MYSMLCENAYNTDKRDKKLAAKKEKERLEKEKKDRKEREKKQKVCVCIYVCVFVCLFFFYICWYLEQGLLDLTKTSVAYHTTRK